MNRRKMALNCGIILALVITGFASPRVTKADDEILVQTPTKQIRLSTGTWKAMENEESYAKNFERLSTQPGEVFPQVVTVFLLEMSQDRRTGAKISEVEYIEAFSGLPGKVTVQVRRQKRGYWVLSRQTFEVRGGFRTGPPSHDFSEAEIRRLMIWFQNEIDRTRFLLQEIF